jgi:hypothetical protein
LKRRRMVREDTRAQEVEFAARKGISDVSVQQNGITKYGVTGDRAGVRNEGKFAG